MKGQDYSDLRNEFSVTTRPTTEPGSVTAAGEIDIKARNAEWAHYCLRHRAVEESTEIGCARVELPQMDGPTEVWIAASFAGGKQMRCTLFFALLGETEPFPVTSYHNRAVESLREGRCLLVPIPDDMTWTDNMWPTSIEELNAFVANLTDSPRYLEAWVMQRSRESNQLLMVVIIQSNVCSGYLLGSQKTAGFSEIRAIPIFFDRVGEFTPEYPVRIELELRFDNLETLLRHARRLQPTSGNTQEDRRLRDALDELVNALEKGESRSRPT
ncbi:hypothetical protein [Pseudomonas taiwanensis]|uniref:hypothetical protein n=1 Tax=Pseudomonas taiwanensis TaxID=470150 RepID=UPI001648A3F9|nr:hypothetical protein [Pseudomonas taiwanensis]MBC3492436.1 hypothetical protein [Pseudomonas taiwanensis]